MHNDFSSVGENGALPLRCLASAAIETGWRAEEEEDWEHASRFPGEGGSCRLPGGSLAIQRGERVLVVSRLKSLLGISLLGILVDLSLLLLPASSGADETLLDDLRAVVPI